MGRVHTVHHTMTLADVQARVDDWVSQFEAGYWPPLSMLARLTEEVGELARELNHTYGHKPKKKNEPAGDIALEVADILFVLVCLCNSLGIDLGTAFERVMHKYDQRDGSRWPRRAVKAGAHQALTVQGSARKASAMPRRSRKRQPPKRVARRPVR
jgi:NTP pyrophosphatase (non-canonical NTP hydrolase)